MCVWSVIQTTPAADTSSFHKKKCDQQFFFYCILKMESRHEHFRQVLLYYFRKEKNAVQDCVKSCVKFMVMKS